MNYPVLDLKATGERINQLRKDNNLRVIDVAEYMGFESTQAVYKWQHRNREIIVTSLRKPYK